MDCKICGVQNKEIFKAELLWKYTVSYFYCSHCWFLQTEEPTWLKEAYESPINIEDTGILSRNLFLSKITLGIVRFFFSTYMTFLDYAWGFWIFTRCMRDLGLDFLWKDLYSENLLARWFAYNNEKIWLMTSFESFEHFVNPIDDIEKMLSISKNILFTTDILPEKVPNPNKWRYYWLSHWQHISFYQVKTLKYIADRYNLYLNTNGKNIHLLTDKKINNTFFKFLLKLSTILPLFIMKLWCKSKTQTDMHFIISNKGNV